MIRYAQARHVTVVPEVELPGHCAAALAAYPNLSCTGGPFDVGTTWGIYKDVCCAGNDDVFEFLERVWDEVLDLFPSPYVHIGGDEVPKDRWTACSRCQRRMQDEGFSSPEELQAWFVRRACHYLRERGRTVIGWDEVLEGNGPGGDTVIMAWRGADRGIEAARRGHRVIMTPNPSTYLNYTPYDPPRPPGHQTRRLSLETAYALDPVPAELDEQEAGRIIGSQACLWTEYVEPTRSARLVRLSGPPRRAGSAVRATRRRAHRQLVTAVRPAIPPETAGRGSPAPRRSSAGSARRRRRR